MTDKAHDIRPHQKILQLPLSILLSLIVMGALGKILHWPYAIWVIAGGYGGILILYPFRFAAKPHKVAVDYAKLALAVFWPLKSILNVFHLPYSFLF